MSMNYPSSFFLSSGKGTSHHKLVSFDNALIDAGISNYNLLKVSSILPIGCLRARVIDLKLGSPLLTAYASISSSISGNMLSTAVAVGVPKSKSDIGLIMEYEHEGVTAKEAEDIAKAMVKESMANHAIDIEDILVTSMSGVVGTGFLTVVSAIVMW